MSGKNREPNLSVGPQQRNPTDNAVSPLGTTLDDFIARMAEANPPLSSTLVTLPLAIHGQSVVGIFMLAPNEKPLGQIFIDSPQDLAELIDLFVSAGKHAFGERAMVRTMIPVISKIATHTLVIPSGELTDDGKTDPENLPN